ncbi:hypothetical protein, partial [Gluconobacter oxydans]|uniref:hypothetical protein n=1 Tax=Gluconobacter oxydans TaxID=442 RepID=UPI0039EB2176
NTTIDSLGYLEAEGAQDVFFRPFHALFSGVFSVLGKGAIGESMILIEGDILRRFGRKVMWGWCLLKGKNFQKTSSISE